VSCKLLVDVSQESVLPFLEPSSIDRKAACDDREPSGGRFEKDKAESLRVCRME